MVETSGSPGFSETRIATPSTHEMDHGVVAGAGGWLAQLDVEPRRAEGRPEVGGELGLGALAVVHNNSRAIKPSSAIDQGRGHGRRTYVDVAGLSTPIVASRSELAILADMKAATGSGRGAADADEQPRVRARRPAGTVASPRPGRLGFDSRRG